MTGLFTSADRCLSAKTSQNIPHAEHGALVGPVPLQVAAAKVYLQVLGGSCEARRHTYLMLCGEHTCEHTCEHTVQRSSRHRSVMQPYFAETEPDFVLSARSPRTDWLADWLADWLVLYRIVPYNAY